MQHHEHGRGQDQASGSGRRLLILRPAFRLLQPVGHGFDTRLKSIGQEGLAGRVAVQALAHPEREDLDNPWLPSIAAYEIQVAVNCLGDGFRRLACLFADGREKLETVFEDRQDNARPVAEIVPQRRVGDAARFGQLAKGRQFDTVLEDIIGIYEQTFSPGQ